MLLNYFVETFDIVGCYKLNTIEGVLGLMPPFIICYMNRLTMVPGKVQVFQNSTPLLVIISEI